MSVDFYEGFTTELIEPITKEGIRGALNHICERLSEDKPLKGMYKDFILEALGKIANGSRPDTAFKWRTHETNPSRQPKLISAMEEIYHRNIKGTKITEVIAKVAKESNFGYEVLKAEWYKNGRAWEKSLDQYYDDINKAYDELEIEAHRPPS